MKLPKIPKRHSQLNLPEGTRVRYSTAAMSKSKNKVLMIGHIHPGKPLANGWYWIRPLNRFVCKKVKANRIKFIEHVPGAPVPRPPRPACPKPQPASVVVSLQSATPEGKTTMHVPHLFIQGDKVLDPVTLLPVRDIEPGEYTATKLAPDAHFNIRGTETGRHFYGADLSTIEQRTLNHLVQQQHVTEFLTPTLAQVLERVRLAITLGDVSDKDLDRLAERIQERRKVMRKVKATKLLAKLVIGDKVTIGDKVKPKYAAGIKGTVSKIERNKVTVTFDKPLRRFGKSCKIPANLLTKD